MANLTFNEKQIFEKLFDRGGWVLDFSDRTFAEFFNDFNINIEAEKYHKNGRSKMKRLRAFWEIESNKIVGEVLEKLLEYANSIETIEEKDNLQAKKYIYKLLGKKIYDNRKELSEDDFLNKELNKIDLTLLNFDFQTESILKQRLKEIEICLKNSASLSVIFLCEVHLREFY